MSLPPADIAWHDLAINLKGKRIGLMLDLGFGLPLEQAVRDVTIAAAKTYEAAGAIVTEVPSVMTGEMLIGLDAFWRARSWDDISKLPPGQQAKILPFIFQWAEGGAKLSGVDVIRGFNATMAIRAEAVKLFANVDYMISPVAPIVKYSAELASPTDDAQRPLEHIGYTVAWNMAENPAVSINGGYDAVGFPIGVQIVGKRFDDLGVLKMAKAFEGLRGRQKPWPHAPA